MSFPPSRGERPWMRWADIPELAEPEESEDLCPLCERWVPWGEKDACPYCGPGEDT